MVPRENQLATSVLVVGTGGSGLRAAIEVAEAGVAVLALGKRPVADAHTSLAAGGLDEPGSGPGWLRRGPPRAF